MPPQTRLASQHSFPSSAVLPFPQSPYHENVSSITGCSAGSTGDAVQYGQTIAMPLADTDVAAMRAPYEANGFSAVAKTQAFLPLLSHQTGIIVNHGSMSSSMKLGGRRRVLGFQSGGVADQ